jgi:hypothetical protein
MTSFLNCNIWSINITNGDDSGFFEIKRIYYYNSDTEEFNNPIPPGFIQIPEFEIQNLYLLQGLDFDFISQHGTPIIRKDSHDKWTIDLRYYEDTYLQHTNRS